MKHLKQEFDKLTFKEVITYIIVIVTLAAGITLLFLDMFIPPEGEIHHSVLTAFGLISIFVGALLGVSIHYDNELEKLKSKFQEQLDSLTQSNNYENI